MNDTVTGDFKKTDIVNELSSSWNDSGIGKGDIVLVHSSLSKYLRNFKAKGIELTPDDILDSFILCVGEKGTLIFPTYNFEFTKEKTYDIRNSKSETGILTEAARLHPEAIRTPHPLFSFAVLGFYKKEFSELKNYNAFGMDSPFAKLMELDGKIAALDVAGEYCMTFYHHVEEMENAPNRFHKKFSGSYIDIDGTESIREFSVYSRKTELGVETDVKPMEEYLWSKGLYKGSRPGEGNCLHSIKARKVYEEAAQLIKAGKSKGILYKISKDKSN